MNISDEHRLTLGVPQPALPVELRADTQRAMLCLDPLRVPPALSAQPVTALLPRPLQAKQLIACA